MKISVHIKPRARKPVVEMVSDTEFRVKVLSSPREGKANEELIEALSDYFGVPKSDISIISGFKSRRKILEIYGK